MEPLISLTLKDRHRTYQPGEEVFCEYQIDAVNPDELQAIEVSVLWHTEGKGDEDLGVHYFQRHVRGNHKEGEPELHELKRFSFRCPNCPLSYDGTIVKIRWCVRVRVFLPAGKEVFYELPFRLGREPTTK